jgi:hypothetical protein
MDKCSHGKHLDLPCIVCEMLILRGEKRDVLITKLQRENFRLNKVVHDLMCEIEHNYKNVSDIYIKYREGE